MPGNSSRRARPVAFAGSNFAPIYPSPLAAIFGLLAAIVGFAGLTRSMRRPPRTRCPERLGGLPRAMRNRFYFDELYEADRHLTHEALAEIAGWFDRWIIAGLAGARDARYYRVGWPRFAPGAEPGNLQTYAFLFALGVALYWCCISRSKRPCHPHLHHLLAVAGRAAGVACRAIIASSSAPSRWPPRLISMRCWR